MLPLGTLLLLGQPVNPLPPDYRPDPPGLAAWALFGLASARR